MRDEITREEIEQVKKAVKQLPDQQRKVIELTFFSELNTQEVGNKLGLPRAHVWTVKSRGLAWLRRIFHSIILCLTYGVGEY
ncbi:RNA polymerase sigma factor [Paraflavitalea speifideaquila]|uniref:RNA polymerase sigma factor n=1 Tax=Paraflavitalea speifideaquila TaxID=3076558 RepID=UPI0028E36BEF|nr:sigma factor-like helix-turn-helix DNA-binding protein [Paraflavitalea speifideiaquila]